MQRKERYEVMERKDIRQRKKMAPFLLMVFLLFVGTTVVTFTVITLSSVGLFAGNMTSQDWFFFILVLMNIITIITAITTAEVNWKKVKLLDYELRLKQMELEKKLNSMYKKRKR